MPNEHRFPRWRRLWRGALRASDFVVHFGGVVLMGLAFAFVGAFFSLPTRPGWGDKFVYGLGVAVLALLLVWGLSIVWQVVRYWLSGGQDRDWEMTAAIGSGIARFTLARKPDAPPGFVHVHETMECVVRTPNGMETIPDRGLFAPKGMSAQATLQGAAYGPYEVRWYGSRRGRFYEITRGKFILDGSDPHWLTPERTTVWQRITRWDRCLDSRGESGLFGRSVGSQSTSKLGEDHQVGVELDSADPPDAQGQE
jgi:hypothetical protein